MYRIPYADTNETFDRGSRCDKHLIPGRVVNNLGFGCCLGLLLVAAGCDVSDPNAKARPVANPAGIAPVGLDPMDGGRAAPAAAQPVAQQPAGQPPAAQPPANDGKGIIGKMTNTVVDVKPAMAANPNLVIVENKSQGDDPMSFAASAYVAARSKASMLGFSAWLKQHKIVEERNPTYAEFMQAMKENHVEFTALYQWQTYGYDAEKGEILILEDPVMKAERYKAAGIDPNQ